MDENCFLYELWDYVSSQQGWAPTENLEYKGRVFIHKKAKNGTFPLVCFRTLFERADNYSPEDKVFKIKDTYYEVGGQTGKRVNDQIVYVYNEIVNKKE